MSPLARCTALLRNALLRSSGFTLVEFLVAVLFLATVAALAVPRVWNMGSEARTAKQQAIFGSVRAAAQITRAAAQVHNQLGATGSVTVDGTSIATIYGYPTATEGGIIAATGLDPSNDQVSLVGGGSQAGNTITVAINGSRATCTIVYAAPASDGAQPAINYVNSNGKGSSGC
jgi:MSHA pilin protein MshA